MGAQEYAMAQTVGQPKYTHLILGVIMFANNNKQVSLSINYENSAACFENELYSAGNFWSEEK